MRADSPYDLTFHVAPELARAELLEVWIDLPLLETLHVEGITPEPESQVIRGDRAIFAVRVADRERDVPVVFRVKAREVGRSTGQVGVVGGPTIELSHFVYP